MQSLHRSPSLLSYDTFKGTQQLCLCLDCIDCHHGADQILPQWPPCVQWHQTVLVSICQTGLAEAQWTAYSQGATADLLYRFPCRREIKPVQILWGISSEPFWGELPWHSHLDSIALPTRSAIVRPTCYSDLKEWCFHSALRSISQPHILVLRKQNTTQLMQQHNLWSTVKTRSLCMFTINVLIYQLTSDATTFIHGSHHKL